jgi:UDP-N-acetyl-D-glucosamine dehydrogenase
MERHAPEKVLIERLESRLASIGIIGLGYVGLPLSLRFAEVGYKVIGMDIAPEKVECLSGGRSYIKHIASSASASPTFST